MHMDLRESSKTLFFSFFQRLATVSTPSSDNSTHYVKISERIVRTKEHSSTEKEDGFSGNYKVSYP